VQVDKFLEIRGLSLFTNISEESFAGLTRGAYVQTFPPMVELITEGEAADFLQIVLSGTVELFASWRDRQTTMATVWPYSTFILAATIKDRPYLMSARTLKKSRIMLIPSEDVRAVYDADPEFSRSIVVELASYYRSSVRNIKSIKLRTSKERLANYLIKYYWRNGQEALFELPFEKRRLASYLSMTPENLSRAFKALRVFGVKVAGQKIHLTDVDALEAFARPKEPR
tara:strand:+ start:36 stop:719 length:684 start_codon:yes stop_codon:yes gene_type:complete